MRIQILISTQFWLDATVFVLQANFQTFSCNNDEMWTILNSNVFHLSTNDAQLVAKCWCYQWHSRCRFMIEWRISNHFIRWIFVQTSMLISNPASLSIEQLIWPPNNSILQPTPSYTYFGSHTCFRGSGCDEILFAVRKQLKITMVLNAMLKK